MRVWVDSRPERSLATTRSTAASAPCAVLYADIVVKPSGYRAAPLAGCSPDSPVGWVAIDALSSDAVT